MKLESNDTRVPKMYKMCKDMQYCVDDSCFVKEHTKHIVEHTCNLLEMVHKRSFAACASKLMKDKPDFLDYECLDGLDLQASDRVGRRSLPQDFDPNHHPRLIVSSTLCNDQPYGVRVDIYVEDRNFTPAWTSIRLPSNPCRAGTGHQTHQDQSQRKFDCPQHNGQSYRTPVSPFNRGTLLFQWTHNIKRQCSTFIRQTCTIVLPDGSTLTTALPTM
ncbi:hypothetical protein L5515_009027 [Caenorhabditis briggsae]|uniref:Uncharacterized protein n=1 Tax=Caenorhabditis briggsae TaxID=6238 RepID=A0AAE9F970_CAEBR|nr:hypothetical protein L5515_009027 [Caenorhabditis briggsae]